MMLRTWTRLAGVAALAALTVGAAGTGVAHADATTTGPTSQTSHSITAVGDGAVEGTPNVLELELGVTTRDPSAATALAHNSELAVKVIGALKNAGVADKDVQTSNLSISPNVSGSGNHVDGYEVGNTVMAKLRDVNKAGDIVDAATKVSSNEIVVQSLSFSFDDNSSMVAAARTLAVKRAQDQARQLADAAGVALGNLDSISSTSVPVGPPTETPGARATPSPAAAPTPPVNPGSQTVSVEVTLVYQIG
ncbi:MAG TPA: SIMPL domain-containing protein [Acidimicrobiia bacterium]